MDCFAKCLPPKDKYVRQPGVRPLLPHFADPNNLRTAADMRKANPALAKRMAEKSRAQQASAAASTAGAAAGPSSDGEIPNGTAMNGSASSQPLQQQQQQPKASNKRPPSAPSASVAKALAEQRANLPSGMAAKMAALPGKGANRAISQSSFKTSGLSRDQRQQQREQAQQKQHQLMAAPSLIETAADAFIVVQEADMRATLQTVQTIDAYGGDSPEPRRPAASGEPLRDGEKATGGRESSRSPSPTHDRGRSPSPEGGRHSPPPLLTNGNSTSQYSGMSTAQIIAAQEAGVGGKRSTARVASAVPSAYLQAVKPKRSSKAANYSRADATSPKPQRLPPPTPDTTKPLPSYMRSVTRRKKGEQGGDATDEEDFSSGRSGSTNGVSSALINRERARWDDKFAGGALTAVRGLGWPSPRQQQQPSAGGLLRDY